MGIRIILLMCLSFYLGSCQNTKDELPPPSVGKQVFQKLEPKETGIVFSNTLISTEEFNIYKYRNFYNGGGVAIGDINNDGLSDIYLTSNMASNRLFLNEGNLKFKDITESAGVGGTKSWSTGVSLADINGDGWLDIYVCNSGDVNGDNKANELFINNQDGTFIEKAAEFGIDDRGYSTHAAFFDYDKDGDLDMYLLNNSYQAIGSFNLKVNEREKRNEAGGDKFFKFEKGRFIDYSKESGIYGSVIGFGLGVTVGDVNGDHWQDIFVSNDFFERDYLYINDKKGGFTENAEEYFQAMSVASMGADMADINNDLKPDIFVTEMLPSDDKRLKTKTTFENWDKYQYNLQNGYYHQFTRNMLHLNNGNESYSDYSRLADVEATDWSWGALIFDMDNDADKDIFVSNGIYQDLTDQDYLNYIASDSVKREVVKTGKVDYAKLVSYIPSEPLQNHLFQNNMNLSFEDIADFQDMDEKSFSNGSAYGDLDNDGDLELVVNNVNMPFYFFKNLSTENKLGNFLSIKLEGDESNTFGIGAKVLVHTNENSQMLENIPNRGFQSSVDMKLIFGLGEQNTVDSIVVIWNDLTRQVISAPTINESITIAKNGNKLKNEMSENVAIFKDISQKYDFNHSENSYSDFDRDKALYHMKSTDGPFSLYADFNGDGLEDMLIGAAKGYMTKLYIQSGSGRFVEKRDIGWEDDAISEDVDATFADFDGDGDLDIYICSGGNEDSDMSSSLSDRLYLNNGDATFVKQDVKYPTAIFESSSTVSSGDIDGDGDIDLFVGIGLAQKYYGVPMNGYVLENDGAANFKLTQKFEKLGLIKDSRFGDIDNDGDIDLAIVGEFMPVTLYKNNGAGVFENATAEYGLDAKKGYFQTVDLIDLDGDQSLDIIVGNIGLNTRLKAEPDAEVGLLVNDFDQNGAVEQIYYFKKNGKSIPYLLKHDLVKLIPSLQRKFVKYEDYSSLSLEEMFTPEQLKHALRLEYNCNESHILWNDGDSFEYQELPKQIQNTMIFAIKSIDVNHDGKKDILFGGNLFNVKPELGRYDANLGSLIINHGERSFSVLEPSQSGLKVQSQIRDFNWDEGKKILFIITNNDMAYAYKLQ